MRRHCDGTDPNLIGEDGKNPCACGLRFDDVDRMVIWPHHHTAGVGIAGIMREQRDRLSLCRHGRKPGTCVRCAVIISGV